MAILLIPLFALCTCVSLIAAVSTIHFPFTVITSETTVLSFNWTVPDINTSSADTDTVHSNLIFESFTNYCDDLCAKEDIEYEQCMELREHARSIAASNDIDVDPVLQFNVGAYRDAFDVSGFGIGLALPQSLRSRLMFTIRPSKRHSWARQQNVYYVSIAHEICRSLRCSHRFRNMLVSEMIRLTSKSVVKFDVVYEDSVEVSMHDILDTYLEYDVDRIDFQTLVQINIDRVIDFYNTEQGSHYFRWTYGESAVSLMESLMAYCYDHHLSKHQCNLLNRRVVEGCKHKGINYKTHQEDPSSLYYQLTKGTAQLSASVGNEYCSSSPVDTSHQQKPLCRADNIFSGRWDFYSFNTAINPSGVSRTRCGNGTVLDFPVIPPNRRAPPTDAHKSFTKWCPRHEELLNAMHPGISQNASLFMKELHYIFTFACAKQLIATYIPPAECTFLPFSDTLPILVNQLMSTQKKIVFVGDSVMVQHYFQFVCAADEILQPIRDVSVYSSETDVVVTPSEFSAVVSEVSFLPDFPCHVACNLSHISELVSPLMCKKCDPSKSPYWIDRVPDDVGVLVLGSGIWFAMKYGNTESTYGRMLDYISPYIEAYIESGVKVVWMNLPPLGTAYASHAIPNHDEHLFRKMNACASEKLSTLGVVVLDYYDILFLD